MSKPKGEEGLIEYSEFSLPKEEWESLDSNYKKSEGNNNPAVPAGRVLGQNQWSNFLLGVNNKQIFSIYAYDGLITTEP